MKVSLNTKVFKFLQISNLSQTYNKATQILRPYDQAGLIGPVVVTCSADSYPKFDENRCVSCGYDPKLTYSTALKACQCATGYIKVG